MLAKSNGVVEKADADHIVVRNEQGALEDYSLIKFARSNAGTCINQRPIVEVARLSPPVRCWPMAPQCATARSLWVRTP